MGVMMGKIVEVNGKGLQLVLQGLDEEDLIKQVDEINEMERKVKAFDEIDNLIVDGALKDREPSAILQNICHVIINTKEDDSDVED